MDELTGEQGRTSTGDYNVSSEFVASEEAKSLEENIISQSLDLKDWMPQIQPTFGVREAKGYNQSGRLRSRSRQSFSLRRILRRLIRTITRRDYFEVLKVGMACYPESEFLWGGYIDFPKEKDQFHGSTVSAMGWVLGKTAQVISVQVKIDDKVIAEVPLQISRPGVVRAFVFVPGLDSENAYFGFDVKLSIKKLPSAGYLRLQAVLADGNIAPLGFIQFSR